MNKYAFLLLSVLALFMVSTDCYSKQLEVVVIDETKQPVCYADIYLNDALLATTDGLGRFTIDVEHAKPLDRISIRSIFYRPKFITIDQLSQTNGNSIVCQSIKYLIPAIHIATPLSLAKKSATSFSSKYIKNFKSDFLFFRTVRSGRKYIEFNARKGVAIGRGFTNKTQFKYQWDDNYIVGCYQSDQFNSYPLQCDANSVLMDGHSATGRIDESSYYNNSCRPLFDPLRALELYSPLNPKAVDDFRYNIDTIYVINDQQIMVLNFTSKDARSFPSKNRIFGSGRLTYNQTTNAVEKIEMGNYLDYYSLFARQKTMLPMAHNSRFSVEYKTVGAQIVLSRIYCTIEWASSLQNGQKLYFIIAPARADSYKNRVVQTYYMNFSNTTSDIPKTLPFGEIAPYTPTQWSDIDKMSPVDMSVVRRDLLFEGLTLEQQSSKVNDMIVTENEKKKR